MKTKDILKNNGITLVALIVTIIVLLLLVGISISAVIGDNGVITHSQGVKKESYEVKAIEEIEMAIGSIMSEYQQALVNNYNADIKDYLNFDNLIPLLKDASGTIENVNFVNGEGDIKYKVNNTDNIYKFHISIDGQVTPVYVVTFNTNGGSSIEPQEVLSGEVIDEPVPPVKDNKTFDKWYIDSSFSEVFEFDEPIYENITIYAKYN